MDPFANSDLFQDSNADQSQSTAFLGSNSKSFGSHSQFGESSTASKHSEFTFSKDTRQDDFFSPKKNDKLIPLSNKFSADTGLRQRNTLAKFSDNSSDNSSENYNIPSFSQLEAVTNEPRGSASSTAIITEPMRSEVVDLFDSAPQDRGNIEDFGRWVVVFGFSPGDYTSPIRALQQYGQITKHIPGGGGNGNYLFVQFATVMDRDHAVSLGATLLSENVLISVSALTPDLASRLRFSEASSTPSFASPSLRGPMSPLGSPTHQRMPMNHRLNRPYRMGDVDGPITEAPQRHVSMCKKIARALFGW